MTTTKIPARAKFFDVPKIGKACEFAGTEFGDGMFRTKGGRALYDEVWVADGGNAIYLCKVFADENGINVIKRWVPWDSEIEQLWTNFPE